MQVNSLVKIEVKGLLKVLQRRVFHGQVVELLFGRIEYLASLGGLHRSLQPQGVVVKHLAQVILQARPVVMVEGLLEGGVI